MLFTRLSVALLITSFCLLILSGCKREYTPKPKAYFKIDFPEKSYGQFDAEFCPFLFEYPTYGRVERDTLFFDQKIEDPCWMDIVIPDYGGTIHLSYKEVSEDQKLGKLIDDMHKLTFKHSIKAEFIDEKRISTANGVYGKWFDVGGNAASNIQFYITDSAQHFLRGSLYFNIPPNEDSMKPVIDFVRADMEHLIGTFQWK